MCSDMKVLFEIFPPLKDIYFSMEYSICYGCQAKLRMVLFITFLLHEFPTGIASWKLNPNDEMRSGGSTSILSTLITDTMRPHLRVDVSV